jgi:hypothetical protein
MGREDQSDRRERHLTSRETSVPKIPTTGSFVGDRPAERWVRGSLSCTTARSQHATNTKEAVGIGCCAHGFAADRAEIRLRRIERFGAEPRHERNHLAVVVDSEGLERLAQAQTELGEVPRVRDERADRRMHITDRAERGVADLEVRGVLGLVWARRRFERRLRLIWLSGGGRDGLGRPGGDTPVCGWCAVMIDAERWGEYIATSPVLYHVTSERDAPAIRLEGLRPGSEIGRSNYEGHYRTRSGRVYLTVWRFVSLVRVDGEPRVFEVTLSALNPELVDPDEDVVAENYDELFRDVVRLAPPTREVTEEGEEVPGQEGDRARWAGSISTFADSAVTVRSLDYGRISYRGTIPPTALRELDVPSYVLARFREALPDALRAACPRVPSMSSGQNEVQRARVLVTRMVLAVLERVGEAAIDVRMGRPLEAHAVERQLRDIARRLGRETRFAEAEALGDARVSVARLATVTGLSDLSDLERAADAAADAAAITSALGRLPVVGAHDATAAMVDAFDAASRVPTHGA